MSVPQLSLADQTSQTRLQILLAKTRLSASEIARANALLKDVDDWQGFFDTAARNFSLPLMRRNLSDLDQTHIPGEILSQIGGGANQTAFSNLRMISAQKQFQDACLKPLGIKGIFFKGVNMAAQYYPDLGLRPCRDSDVLVPKGTMAVILQKALEEGYVPIAPDGTGTLLTNSRDINAVLHFGDSVTLITPEHVVIDLQDHLDKHSGIFSPFDIHGNADAFSIGGDSFATLPTAFLFNYLCHHHTRHTWSRLHWLSDLDAICSSDRFDREAVLALADTLGQKGTVEASLELHQLMSTDTPWEDTPDLERGKIFLKLSILNLPGDLDLEKKLSLNLMGGEFMFDWQVRPDLIAKARRGWWRYVFRPTVAQYARMPLPKALHWIYYIQRPFELFQQALKRIGPIRRE